ncbi:hypothetical protein QBC36DRAFT_106552 [Triangularia setosa]|uniref:Uncharacterized protein n=1 Tax=Triangularia setosa TaxID=2587417 RepID=A0AAN6VWI5_9PEZI|nr:hypothetical protein QBC36DRAFT_106552 [Podospora setosa]
MAKQLSITNTTTNTTNTTTPKPPPSIAASTQIGENDYDDLYGPLTPCSTVLSFHSSATTSRAVSPQRRHPKFCIPLSLPYCKEDAIPTPGKIYIITALHLPSSPNPYCPIDPDGEDNENNQVLRAMTLCGGQLRLQELRRMNITSGCWFWECVTKEGWLGFRNVASGMYLGHNGRLELVANAPHCKGWEWFCVRRVPFVDWSGEKEKERDGYVMLLKHWDSLRWLDVSITPDGAVNKERWYLTGSEKSAVWGFVEVGEHGG